MMIHDDGGLITCFLDRQSSAEDTEKEELDREYSLMMGRSNSTTAVAAQ